MGLQKQANIWVVSFDDALLALTKLAAASFLPVTLSYHIWACTYVPGERERV